MLGVEVWLYEYPKGLTLAAREPYSDSVFMSMARKSTMPQLWSVFATARAPISSTSEKMSVSTMMGLGSSTVERELAVAHNRQSSSICDTAIESIVASTLSGQFYRPKVIC